jgi:serine/threonine protein kinase
MSEDFAALGGVGTGSRVAGYLLEEQIGQGGMAVVFRALDERLNRHVALKVLASAIAADEAFRHRFIRESQAAAAVDDPHIIPVYQAGEVDKVLFIAMRLVRGGDVTTLVRREGPLTPRRAATIISAVASSLDAAHEAGLVHRDVKPANILLDIRQGRPDHVYLSDFGLSKSAFGVSGITATGQFLGTPSYIAPEQIDNKTIDGRADQYSLAATAFELLSGTPPFRGDQPMAVVYAHLSEPPPALTSRRPDLPRAVDAVFARALAKNPADRFGSCQEFAEEMRRALGIARYDARTGLARTAHPPHPPTEAVVIPAEVAGSQEPQRPAPGSDRGGRGAERSPTEVVWAAPQPTPQPTPVFPFPTPTPTPTSPFRPSYQAPPRRRRGRAAAIVAALIVVLGGAGAAVYLSGGHGHGRQTPRVAKSGKHSVRKLLVLGGGSRQNVVEGVAFSPDSRTLAIATVGATFLVDVASGHRLGSLTDPEAIEVKAVAFSADGSQLATADKNGRVYLWDVAGGAVPSQPTSTLPDPAGSSVFAVAYSPRGNMLATGDASGVTYLWHVGSGAASSSPYGHVTDPSGAAVQGVAFNPHGEILATGDASGHTYLWTVGSGAVPVSPTATLIVAASKGVQAVTIGPHGHDVVTGDANGATYVWRTSTVGLSTTPKATLTDPGPVGQFGVVSVAFSPNGRTLATAGYTGQTYLWHVAGSNIARIATLTEPGIAGQGGDVQAAQFSPDGKGLATGDTNGGTYFWPPSS